MLRFPTVLEVSVDRNDNDRQDRRFLALVLKMRADGATGYDGLTSGRLKIITSKLCFHLTPHGIPAEGNRIGYVL